MKGLEEKVEISVLELEESEPQGVRQCLSRCPSLSLSTTGWMVDKLSYA